MSQPKCSVIIISYNNENHLKKNFGHLKNQSLPPSQIIIVDTGSTDRAYLDAYRHECDVVLANKNCGFCVGNNLGFRIVHPDADYVFFLNPDAFIAPDYIERATLFLSEEKNHHYGAVTGLTLGYDFEKESPTGRIDTTGIYSTWYGKWYDRGQGIPHSPEKYNKTEIIPAICGALFFCRKEALAGETEVMKSRFYMYKEDIDLSLRIRNKGWKLAYVPELQAYHCRGWSTNRKLMDRRYRLCSAINELKVNYNRKHPLGCLYSLSKYLAVKVLDC